MKKPVGDDPKFFGYVGRGERAVSRLVFFPFGAAAFGAAHVKPGGTDKEWKDSEDRPQVIYDCNEKNETLLQAHQLIESAVQKSRLCCSLQVCCAVSRSSAP
jgi:hypothetical protein